VLSPDPILIPRPDFEEGDQTLDVSDLVLERSTTETQQKVGSESLDVDCLVCFRIPDHTKK
jgi:hypothetical protein